jgi:hypothetical protein
VQHSKQHTEQEIRMKTFIAIAFLAGIGLAGISASQAMPVAPLNGAENGTVTLASQGCGLGRHRGPYNGCRPNFTCPPGWHSGPFGHHCFRN